MGPATAHVLQFIGIETPQQLVGKDPLALYESLCRRRGARQDPCVLDVFISITRFMAGDPPRAWWEYTALRKRMYGAKPRQPRR